MKCCTKCSVELAIANQIKSVIIGFNPGIKQENNIGKRNNQTAVATTLGEIRNALPQLCGDSPLAVEVKTASAV